MPPPPARTLSELRQRIQESLRHRSVIRFSLCEGRGWLKSTELVTGMCCDLYNNRALVGSALRLVAALDANPQVMLRMQTGGCTCGVMSPDPKYHSDLCVYAACCEVLDAEDARNPEEALA
jgi:hypothetical protein